MAEMRAEAVASSTIASLHSANREADTCFSRELAL
jgi:hypothetical protein